VCVLGLLAGLLGMHGLAPQGGFPEHSHTSSAHTAPTAESASSPAAAQAAASPASAFPVPSAPVPEAGPYRPAPAAAAAHDGCGATDGSCGGGHVRHADTTCASGAVGGGPALPALAPDPSAPAVRAEAAPSRAARTPDGARAPPSLSELQLLRI
jgi:hypothetical protein